MKRLHKLAKEVGIKSTDAVNGLRKRGYNYSITSGIEKDDEENIRELMLEIIEENKVEVVEHEKLSFITFVGISYNEETDRYHRVKLVVKYSELDKIEKDLIELGDHKRLAGAKVELSKDLMRNIFDIKER